MRAVVAGGSGGAGRLGDRSPRPAENGGGPKGHRRPRAVVAMSGGVDSSVAAALLVEEGYDVTGIMLKLWTGDDINNASGCCSLSAADDARRVADVLGIPFYVHNYAGRFQDTVVRNFKDDYLSGRTPNPCVRCNQWIKFGTLLERARVLGADVLATGHYARVGSSGGRRRLLRGVDETKDQSYVLWMLSQDDLAHVRFPVGEMRKTETREIAAGLGFRTARKPDSQEICFVRNGDFDAYVDEHLAPAARPGPIVDGAGAVLGEHRGVGHYTVGQRKGLGVALGAPVFVTRIEADANTVVVGGRDELATDALEVEETSFTDVPPPPGTALEVQYRAHGDACPAVIETVYEGWARVRFDNPAEAVAPGQSAAFYCGEELIGGGVIRATVPAGADA